MNLGVLGSSRKGRKWKAFTVEMVPVLERAWGRRKDKVLGGFERACFLEFHSRGDISLEKRV